MPVGKTWNGSSWESVSYGSDGPIIKSATAPADTTALWIDTSSSGVNPIAAGIGDAKGDLIGFSAADTPVKIDGSSAADGSFLRRLASGTGGVEWSLNGKLAAIETNAASTVANSGAAGSYVAVKSITVTGDNVHGMWIECWGDIDHSAAGVAGGIRIRDGAGVILQDGYANFNASTARFPFRIRYYQAPWSGSKTFKMDLFKNTGGTLTIMGGSGNQHGISGTWVTPP